MCLCHIGRWLCKCKALRTKLSPCPRKMDFSYECTTSNLCVWASILRSSTSLIRFPNIFEHVYTLQIPLSLSFYINVYIYELTGLAGHATPPPPRSPARELHGQGDPRPGSSSARELLGLGAPRPWSSPPRHGRVGEPRGRDENCKFSARCLGTAPWRIFFLQDG